MAALVARAAITADDLSPVVSIMAWVLAAASILGVVAKIWIKLAFAGNFDGDDVLLILALVMSACQTAAASVQAANGIGQPLAALSDTQLLIYQKAGYASDILFVASLALSKTVVLLLCWEITPITSHRRALLACGGAIAVWSVASIFAVAFQCPVPQTWAILSPRCFDQHVFWTFYGAYNIATEVALIILPLWIFWRAKIDPRSKGALFICFSTRVTVIIATILQILQGQQLTTSTDRTFDSWRYALCTQFVQNLSLITVCIPYVKNLLLGLESGYFQTGNFHWHLGRKAASSKFGASSHGDSGLGSGPPPQPTHRDRYELEEGDAAGHKGSTATNGNGNGVTQRGDGPAPVDAIS